MIRKIWRKFGPNPFERLLCRAKLKNERRFLLIWNRGLGDIALGLYALVVRIRQVLPDAAITFITRPDLKDGFSLLEGVQVLVSSMLKRGTPFEVQELLSSLGKTAADYDVLIEKPDPTYWVRWQLGTLVPKMRWENAWDLLSARLLPEEAVYVGIQPQTQTNYGYEKNWPETHWRELIERLTLKNGVKVVLFGHADGARFARENVIDLRGKTSLPEMLSIIKNRCDLLIVPDSGVLSLTYFLDAEFPLDVVSLWADPKQGVLKQNVHSPNKQLRHTPILAPEGDLSRVSVDEVWEALCSKI